MGLPQTYQYTDKLDKKYNIFYDIFFDSVEIQRRTGISYYGPVLFVYSIDVLNIIPENYIRITKTNPEKWKNGLSDKERYFCTLEELSLHFDRDNFGQHITIINQRQPLSFDYLDKIILSDPQKENNFLFEQAYKMIESLTIKLGLHDSLTIRNYNYNNRFYTEYADNEKVQKHFGLGGHR